MDFNSLTIEQEKAAVAKFKEYGKGVVMGKYVAALADQNSAKWSDLTDTDLFSANAIKNKMLEVARQLNTQCNDEFLGDLTIAFTCRDNKNKLVRFTWVEMYLFLRGALRYRKETQEYKDKAEKLAVAKAFVEENKSTEDKLKEATELITKLEQELA